MDSMNKDNNNNNTIDANGNIISGNNNNKYDFSKDNPILKSGNEKLKKDLEDPNFKENNDANFEKAKEEAAKKKENEKSKAPSPEEISKNVQANRQGMEPKSPQLPTEENIKTYEDTKNKDPNGMTEDELINAFEKGIGESVRNAMSGKSGHIISSEPVGSKMNFGKFIIKNLGNVVSGLLLRIPVLASTPSQAKNQADEIERVLIKNGYSDPETCRSEAERISANELNAGDISDTLHEIESTDLGSSDRSWNDAVVYASNKVFKDIENNEKEGSTKINKGQIEKKEKETKAEIKQLKTDLKTLKIISGSGPRRGRPTREQTKDMRDLSVQINEKEKYLKVLKQNPASLMIADEKSSKYNEADAIWEKAKAESMQEKLDLIDEYLAACDRFPNNEQLQAYASGLRQYRYLTQEMKDKQEMRSEIIRDNIGKNKTDVDFSPVYKNERKPFIENKVEDTAKNPIEDLLSKLSDEDLVQMRDNAEGDERAKLQAEINTRNANGKSHSWTDADKDLEKKKAEEVITPDSKDPGDSITATGDIKTDSNNIIMLKSKINDIDSQISGLNRGDPNYENTKAKLEVERESAEQQLDLITHSLNVSMDDVLNYGKEGEEVEKAIRRGDDDEGFLTRAWHKKARDARNQIKDIKNQIKSAKAEGEDTTELESRLEEAKDKLDGINNKYGYFLYDSIKTGLGNMAIPGAYGRAQGNKQSLWDYQKHENLKRDVDRYNTARDATVQEMIDGLANRNDISQSMIMSANDLLKNKSAEIQASKLGIFKNIDTFVGAMKIKDYLKIAEWEDFLMIATIAGLDPKTFSSAAVVQDVGGIINGLFGKHKGE